MNKYAVLPLLVLITYFNGATAFCFVTPLNKSTKQADLSSCHGDSFAPCRDRSRTTWSSITLRQARYDDDISGTKRGIPILAVVLLGCLWCFTIPPEFRRAHICPTPSCVESRESCYDCKTLSELRSGIQGYYKNGGGVVWDFSIDPETKLDFFKWNRCWNHPSMALKIIHLGGWTIKERCGSYVFDAGIQPSSLKVSPGIAMGTFTLHRQYNTL